MPCIRDKSTVDTLARAFTSNGRNQEQAMLDVGYSPAYANSYCGKMWENPRLKAAIARIDAEQAQIGHRTVENLDSMYQKGFDVAEKQNNPTGMATNTTGIARLYNMDQPADGDTTQPLSPEQRIAAMAAAKAATGPKLSKETG